MADVSNTIYTPSPIQQEGHLCSAREMLLGGSAGPGKTLFLIMDPIQVQLHVENARYLRGEIEKSAGWAIHFRREFPMLAQTIDRCKGLYPKIDPGVKYSEEQKTFTFSCGYKIQFAHMAKEDDWRNYDSSQYCHIAFDEVCQFEREQYEMLCGRCRTSDTVLRGLLRIRSATNPHPGWVREYFVDPAPMGRKLLSSKIEFADGSVGTRERIFIPARLSDNPDKEYVKDYEATLRRLPVHIMKARLYGDWYVISGAFFAEEWKVDLHVVEPFEIPNGWTKFRSMDWGYKTWCVVLWWAVDTEGNMVCYRERSYNLKDADEVAFRIREIETAAGEWDTKNDCSLLTGPADTQIWEQRGTIGPTIQETFSSYGVYWQKCTKNRAAAAAQIIKRLRDLPGKNSTGSRPGISWFSTCEQSIKTIPSLPTDTLDAEVPEKGGMDHWLDATFYAVMHRAAIPKHDEREKRRRGNVDDLEEAREKRAHRGRLGYGGF
jgi:hypothetical protein